MKIEGYAHIIPSTEVDELSISEGIIQIRFDYGGQSWSLPIAVDPDPTENHEQWLKELDFALRCRQVNEQSFNKFHTDQEKEVYSAWLNAYADALEKQAEELRWQAKAPGY